jgi:cell wall-associated NlpC family hydrolase
MFKDLIGAPFEYGKMDCEILVQKVFGRYNIDIPDYNMARSAINLYNAKERIDLIKKEIAKWTEIEEPEVPCLVALSRFGHVTHVGVYVGDGKFIHTTSTRGSVTIERLSSPLYRNTRFYRFNSNSSD